MNSKDILLKLFHIKCNWSTEQLRQHKLWPKTTNNINKIYFSRLTCINNKKWDWVLYRFAEQNPDGKSKYARLVRDGQYKQNEICWLYCRPEGFNNKILWLGVVGRDILQPTSNFHENKHKWFINI